MKPDAIPVLRTARLLDQHRELIRFKHYSLRTELWAKSCPVLHQLTALGVFAEEQLWALSRLSEASPRSCL
jgi:hypothetical protein